jgi:phenylalanine-4-hydroxylase
MYVEQDYGEYNDEQHVVWAELRRRRMPGVEASACKAFLDGVRLIGLDDRIPDISMINSRLAPLTGWAAVPVDGYLPATEFFLCLSRRRFPTTITIREARNLEYTEAPDIFHDVFGHVPLHSDPEFADFLQRYGQVALGASGGELVQLARLFWFTVEFGLVKEGGTTKLFGSGLMSSIGEGEYALGDSVERRPFNLPEIVSRPFEIDKYQPLLFVAESFGQIRDSLDEWSLRAGRSVVP